MNKEFEYITADNMSLCYRKLVCGIGINDAWYKIYPIVNGKKIMCPIYRRWCNMLHRCYSAQYHEKYPTYINCLVCDGWLHFMKFHNWMTEQDWKGKHLDKDILSLGNKIYSPEMCVFVAAEVNLLLTDARAIRGKYPIGVTLYKGGRFKVALNIGTTSSDI